MVINKKHFVHKKCSYCGLFKPLYEFHQDPTKKDGRCNQCKQCKNKKMREHYKTHKLQISYREKSRKKDSKRYKVHGEQIRKHKYNKYHNPQTDKQFIKKHGNKQYQIYSGGRFVHDVIAEKTLGRGLKKGECVHHVDGNGLNNENDNLLICTLRYHTYLHRKISKPLPCPVPERRLK